MGTSGAEGAMFESEDEIRELQALMDRTLARANPHLLAIVKPERRLNARQVVRYLQGTKHVAFATVNARGEPRVAPLDGVFIRGRFTVSTEAVPHASATWAPTRPAAPRTWTATRSASSSTVGRRSSAAATKASRRSSLSGGRSTSRARSNGARGVVMRIEPSSMWAYAFHSENFPE